MSSHTCAVCHTKGSADWAWQPFGPDESVLCFALAGSHYRGFPVVPVCNQCKKLLERKPDGHPIVFTYQGLGYALIDNQVVRFSQRVGIQLDK